jgi:hypothetical protein
VLFLGAKQNAMAGPLEEHDTARVEAGIRFSAGCGRYG